MSIVSNDLHAVKHRRFLSQNPVEIVAESLRIIDPDQTFELRVLDAVGCEPTYSGWFRPGEFEAAAAEAVRFSGRGGVYFTINPIRPECFRVQGKLFAGEPSRMYPAANGARDIDVIDRRILPIDIDPVRAIKGGFATEAEKSRAFDLAGRIIEYLTTVHRLPMPAVVDSGNGWYLLFRIESLPCEDSTVRRVLMHLADMFDGEDGTVDVRVSNPSRIMRVPGTLNCKGPSTEERPHRLARLVGPGDGVATREQIEELAKRAPPPKAPPPPAVPLRIPADLDREEVFRRARGYMRTVAPAVSEVRGHNSTYRAACKLVVGFALSVNDAYPLLAEWNLKCEPPWSEHDLRRKLEQVDEKETGPRGELLAAFGEYTGPVVPVDYSDLTGLPAAVETPPEPSQRPNTSVEPEKERTEVFGRTLTRIIGPEPPHLPCRYLKTYLRSGPGLDAIKVTCGKCLPCQDRRRHAEKAMHCRAALVAGCTHIWEGEDEEWEAFRKRLERLRKRLGIEDQFPVCRVATGDGCKAAVRLSGLPPEVLDSEANLREASPEVSSQLLADAIDGIPLQLPKGAWRIKTSRNWKLVGGIKKKVKNKESQWVSLGVVQQRIEGGFDDVEKYAQGMGVETKRSSLSDIRISDRIVFKTASEEEENGLAAEVFGVNLTKLKMAAITRALEAAERRESRARFKSLMKEFGTLARNTRAILRKDPDAFCPDGAVREVFGMQLEVAA